MRKIRGMNFYCRARMLFLILSMLAAMVRTDGAHAQSVKSHVPDSILSHIFKSASVYAEEVSEFHADLYLKGLMKVHKRNRIIKYVPSMFKFEKGIRNYIHESISELHYTAPHIFERKIRAIATTFPGGNSRFFDIMDFLKFNIYSPSVMGDKLLSPLNESTSVHYRYVLDSIAYSPRGMVYKISVTPRFRSTQLMEGDLWISSDDWTIRHMDFKGQYDLTRFHVSMTMGTTEETRYLPQLLNLDVYFSFMRNRLEMNYTGWLNYDRVKFREAGEKRTKAKNEYNLSKSYVLTCDTTRLVEDKDSFARVRPLPLNNQEDSLYRSFDKRRMNEDFGTLGYQTKRKRNLVLMGQIGDALISSYDIDFSKLGNVRFSPLINPMLFGYSHSRGVSYSQEFKYNKLSHTGRLLHLAPQIGYNFTKKELYAKLDGEFVYNPRKHGSISLNVGNGNRIYSSVVLDQLRALPDSTFNFNDLDLEYFKDVYLNLLHNIEIVNGLNIKTGVSMHWRYTATHSEEVSDKVPLHYNSFAPRLRIEWTPGMYYYMNGNRKVNVGSAFPTFVIDYEQGLKILSHSNSYKRFETSAEQKIQIRNLHSIAYHLGYGFFAKQDDVYFVDYVDFASRNLPQGWDDDIGGTFQMLDSRWYNASRHYLRGNMTYETPFLLLYPVSKILSFIQKERLYAGFLFMPRLNPYLEVGYGFGTHLFDFGVFIGNENGKFTSVGCKFTFELFNK